MMKQFYSTGIDPPASFDGPALYTIDQQLPD